MTTNQDFEVFSESAYEEVAIRAVARTGCVLLWKQLLIINLRTVHEVAPAVTRTCY